MKAGRLALPIALLVAPWGCAQLLDFDSSFESGSTTSSATGAGGAKSTSSSSVASSTSVASGAGGAGGASGTGGDAGEDSGTDGSDGSDGSPPLVCDPRFTISASPVVAEVPFTATFTDATPYVYIALSLDGPGAPKATNQMISGSGPYSWKWTVSGQAAGTLTLTFVKDLDHPSPSGTIVGTCQVAVEPAVGDGGPG